MTTELLITTEEYSPQALVRRAVNNARPHRCTEAPRWVAVKDVFGVGSTVAHELCRRHGLDPYEKVAGIKCYGDECE